MSKRWFSWISLRDVTLALYWNYSNAGLCRNGEISIIMNWSIHRYTYIAAMPLTSGMQLPSFIVRFPVSLSLMSQASASFTRFCSFLFVSFNLFFSFSLLGIYGTFSDGRCATIHSRLGDYSELTPPRVDSRICRGQFKSHVSHV